jgi:hypothetical protein
MDLSLALHILSSANLGVKGKNAPAVLFLRL